MGYYYFPGRISLRQLALYLPGLSIPVTNHATLHSTCTCASHLLPPCPKSRHPFSYTPLRPVVLGQPSLSGFLDLWISGLLLSRHLSDLGGVVWRLLITYQPTYSGPPFGESCIAPSRGSCGPDSSGNTRDSGTNQTQKTLAPFRHPNPSPSNLAHRLAPLATPSASRRPKLHRSTTSNPTIPADRPQRPDSPICMQA